MKKLLILLLLVSMCGGSEQVQSEISENTVTTSQTEDTSTTSQTEDTGEVINHMSLVDIVSLIIKVLLFQLESLLGDSR